MEIYCTSKNTGPSWNSDPITMIYLGTSFEEAKKSVGEFSRYEKDIKFDVRFYTALPKEIETELVRYYMADGWWYTIVKFELEECHA